MGRGLNRLSAVQVGKVRSPAYYADGGCLYLRVASGGSKSWIFRFTISGRTRDAGLGSYPALSLADAREEAERCRRLVAAGIDPIEARRKEREAELLASSKAMTFDQCAKAYIAAHETSWKNEKHKYQWRATFAAYCYPVIGALPVRSVDTGLVLEVLEPIWNRKPETASRVRQRIERVLSWAKVRGYREGENPAQWRGHLDHLLPAKGKVRRVRHLAALPFREMARFTIVLRQESSISARGLEFTILTAARTGEALGATWDEMNLSERVWVIPAERMKGGREHRVPFFSNSAVVSSR
jgi:integrase